MYEKLHTFKPVSEKSFLQAHLELMKGLVSDAGKYRKQGVGIVKGTQLKHVAPLFKNVPYLMKDLFSYLKNSDDLTLIKSCVFHYEMEFIHPFVDGNGRTGRLWQTLILMSEYPVFENLPFETLISETQKNYYKSLAMSDKAGKSTHFIEYMLHVINQSLENILKFNRRVLKDTDRLEYFISQGKNTFTRKDYMNVFKGISTATASRDLKKGLGLKLFSCSGTKNKTVYTIL